MRCLCHVFSWLTQCNQAFPLADCSEENPVPYSAGNRDHRVTDGTQNRACNRGNTDALRRVKYPVHRTGKLFTGLRPEKLTHKLKEGWQPFGSPVAITPYTLMQAIAAEGDVVVSGATEPE